VNTRGRPFEPGNSGKPPGALNRATRLAAELLDNEGEALTRKAVELALAGDIGALRLCLERIYPARRARVQIDLPKVETAADLPKAMSAVLAAMAAGEIAPEEGSAIASSISAQCRVLELCELEQRVAALEQGSLPR